MVHISEVAVDYIWNKFSTSYFDQATIDLNKRIGKIIKALNHKPFNSKSKDYINFLKKIYTDISMIECELPLVLWKMN